MFLPLFFVCLSPITHFFFWYAPRTMSLHTSAMHGRTHPTCLFLSLLSVWLSLHGVLCWIFRLQFCCPYNNGLTSFIFGCCFPAFCVIHVNPVHHTSWVQILERAFLCVGGLTLSFWRRLSLSLSLAGVVVLLCTRVPPVSDLQHIGILVACILQPLLT